ncbi:calcium-permeable channel component Mid1 [Lasioglossum baleicum]|uniref:calcium-permeable channel component Mid1 n=1 Tax=Lasioglossum baleicum TaxID=434251 RepID=UPI003FCE5EC8
MLLDPPGFTGPPTSSSHPSSNRSSSFARRRSSCSSPCPGRRDGDLYISERSETGNATAFNVSFDSVSISVARNVTNNNATGSDERDRRSSGSRGARGKDHHHRWPVHCQREDGDTEDSDVRFSSTSRRSGSRSSRPGKNTTQEEDRGARTATVEDQEEKEEVSTTVSVADVTNVPSVDASFAYTAYNNAKNEAGSGRDVCASSNSRREIELVRDQDRGEEDFREPRGTDREVCDAKHGEGEGSEVVWLGRENERSPGGSRARFRRDRSCGSDYTARFQEPTTNERRLKDEELATTRPTTSTTPTTTTTTKVSGSRGRSYGLLFVLYLLAWPLACSTNPSGQFASRFARNPSLGPVDEVPRHNVTQISSLLLSSSSSSSSSLPSSSSNVVYQPATGRQQHLERERYVQDTVYGENEKKNSGSGETVGHRRHGRREAQQGRGNEQREAAEQDSVALYQSYQSAADTENSGTVHPYNEYSWEVNQINPWLSACDLAGPAPADLQGSCGPPEVPKNCPVPCSTTMNATNNNNNNGRASKVNGVDAEFYQVIEKVGVAAGRQSRPAAAAGGGPGGSSGGGGGGVGVGGKGVHGRNEGGTDGQGRPEGVVRMAPEQCLFYLEESHKKDVCRDDFGRSSTRSFVTPRENRYWFVSGLRLRHCCEHAVVNALAPGKGGPLENVLNGGQKCVDALDKLLLVDALAARLHCEFEEVLARYDCAQPYSVIFNCTHCKEAYRKWVCSSLVPYFAHGGPQDSDTSGTSWTGNRLRPCRSFCQSVEQRCPYLLPGDRAPAYPTQYAGEPTFLCRDPNIPETGEQAARALHNSGEDECCFRVCSDEKPGSGICTNCSDREPRERGRAHDPPTAPYCEINPIQPASTDKKTASDMESSSVDGVEEESSSPTSVVQQSQSQAVGSLCLPGGVGSIPSVSSSDRPSASMIPQALWVCSMARVLFSLATWIRGVGSRLFRMLATVVIDVWRTGRLGDLVAWLHGSSSANGRVSCVSARHGAKWLLEKWVMVERRCRVGWWRWWWRRLRKRLRVRLRGCCESGGCADRGAVVRPARPARPCGGCSSPRVRPWTRNFGPFATQCRWRWWWWWRWRWWWLYRWWKSRWKWRRVGAGSDPAVEYTADGDGKKQRPPVKHRRRSRRTKGGLQEWSGGNGYRLTLAVRRRYPLPSRKDPP